MSISDAQFQIVAEVNLTWVAPDLNGEAISPAGTYTGRAINKILDNSWDPGIYVANAEGPRDTIARSLVVYPDGKMELYEKFAAQLTMDTSVPSYPFSLIDVHLEIQSANHPLPGLVFAPRRFDFGHHDATHTVVKGNWSLNDHHSETIDISSLSHGGSSRFSVAVFHISIVHDFMDVAQKILAPLLAILLLSLIINRFSVIYATESGADNGSWRVGGQLTLLLTLFALKFSLGDYIPATHYLTLIDALFIAIGLLVVFTLTWGIYIIHLFQSGRIELAGKLERYRNLMYSIACLVSGSWVVSFLWA